MINMANRIRIQGRGGGGGELFGLYSTGVCNRTEYGLFGFSNHQQDVLTKDFTIYM